VPLRPAHREDGEALGLIEDTRRGKVEVASHGSARQKVTLKAGISQELERRSTRWSRPGAKNISSSIQGDQVRVTGKQRDDLQTAIAFFKEADMEVPCSSQTSRLISTPTRSSRGERDRYGHTAAPPSRRGEPKTRLKRLTTDDA